MWKRKSSKLLKISEKRCIEIYQYLWDFCSTKLLATLIMLGGRRVVAQIDESLFVHSKKFNLKYYNCCTYFSFVFSQNGCGCHPAWQQWVFGMVDTSTRPSVGYMELGQQLH